MPDVLTFDHLTVAVGASAAPKRIADGWLLPTGRVALLHPFGDTEFYRHGWNSWSPSGWARLSGPTIGIKDSPDRLLTADDAVNETPHAHTGSAVGALQGPDGDVLLLGALGLGTPRVGADANTLWGSVEDAGGEWFVAYGPEQVVFAAYTRLLGERLGHRASRAGRVWSSWYSYYEGIDEALVARTVDDLRGYPFDTFQLDDGWEPRVGDWDAGDDFPSGMAATARTIRDGGFRPGLWLAPLIALPTSEIALARPDLMVKDEHGAPMITGYNWGSGYYSLDTTLPEVREHLRDVFARVTGWGFQYLKLDFMYAGAVPGVRSRDLPREQVYREAVQHIRAVVGDDTYLLGCGVPMIPSIGVFDGVRVGPDVGPYWDCPERAGDPSGVGAKNSIASSINRSWLMPAYELDPDAVYFRSERNLLDPAQRQLLQDVGTVLRFRSTSDPIEWLRPEERDQLRTYFGGDATVEQLGRYLYRIDGRLVDFAPATGAAASPYPVSTLLG